MKSRFGLLVFCIIAFSVTICRNAADVFASSTKPLALVYRGHGACEDDGFASCSNAAAYVAHKAGFAVRFVEAGKINPNTFRNASVWIQPGGNALEVNEALKKEEMELIKQFVWNGGAYIGYCAGAYLAGSFLDNADTIPGLNILPAYTYEYSLIDKESRVEQVYWRGALRHVYFQDGAAFRMNEGVTSGVIARYAFDNAVAVVEAQYGSGVVVASGPHPEAPASWFKAESLVDPDGVDLDLALDLFRSVKRIKR